MENILVYIMGLLYILAGINHFLHSKFYKRMMPTLIPWHYPIVYISGSCEIVLGLLLFLPATRTTAAWGIIVLLIIIFPANIQMMINYYRRKNPYLWVTIVRLPLQAVLIWWAWLYTN